MIIYCGCDHRDFDVGQKVRHQMTLFDESVCKYRAVTDLTWSPKVLLLSIAPAGCAGCASAHTSWSLCSPSICLVVGGWWWQLVQDMDLIAVSYSANETGISEEPDGCVCVWSLQNTLQRPESVLQCQVTPLFHPHAHAHEI